MNMEDRLREAFDQEAEHLHAPSGSPETAVRRGRRRRASNLIGGATLILALVGGTAAGVQLLGDTEDPPEQDLAAATETAQTDESATTDELSSLPTVDFSWERVELPTPDGAQIWTVNVAQVDGGFVALGRGDLGTSGEGGGQLLAWRSPDGRTWELDSSGSPFDGFVDDVLVTDEGFVAVVRSELDDSAVALYTSADGTNWTRGEVDLGLASDQYMWFSQAAAGDGVTVVAGISQTEPPSPTIRLEDAGVAVQQSRSDGSFVVTSLETGEVIAEVPADTVFGETEGLAVYDEVGDLIIEISWELLDETPGEAPPGDTLAIEQDGIRLELNYSEYTYLATDVASGDVLAQGSQEDLYRPPSLQITDPESGELIVELSLDEFYEAEGRAYDDSFRPESTLLALRTSDGTTWERIDLPIGGGEEVDLSGLGYGSDRFLLTVGRYGPESSGQETWSSTSGRSWEMVSSSTEPRGGSTVGWNDDLYSLSYGNRGQATISQSADGNLWVPVFESDSSGYYLSTLAAGELGLVAFGQISDFGISVEPILISKDGRTLLFDTAAGGITVTEDATGEVLLEFEFDVFSTEPPPQFQLDDETGTVTIVDDNGTVLMVITEAEGEAAASSSEVDSRDFDVPRPVVLVSRDGLEWVRATTGGLDIGWGQNLAVGADTIVIVGESAEAYAESFDTSTAPLTSESSDSVTIGPATTIVGAPPIPLAPSTYIWVGQQK